MKRWKPASDVPLVIQIEDGGKKIKNNGGIHASCIIVALTDCLLPGNILMLSSHELWTLGCLFLMAWNWNPTEGFLWGWRGLLSPTSWNLIRSFRMRATGEALQQELSGNWWLRILICEETHTDKRKTVFLPDKYQGYLKGLWNSPFNQYQGIQNDTIPFDVNKNNHIEYSMM